MTSCFCQLTIVSKLVHTVTLKADLKNAECFILKTPNIYFLPFPIQHMKFSRRLKANRNYLELYLLLDMVTATAIIIPKITKMIAAMINFIC